MKNNILCAVFLSLVLLAGFLLTACPDGQKMADSIFKKSGMNRLRTVTTRVKPSGIILVKKGKSSYIGEIADFAGEKPPRLTISEDDAIIAATNTNTSSGGGLTLKKSALNTNTAANTSLATSNPIMNAATAVQFLNAFLPVSAEGKIQFSGSVQLNQIYAKDVSIKVSDIQNYINTRQQSDIFLENMKDFAIAGFDIYIVYEAFKSDKLKLVTTSARDISANANFNQFYDIGAGFSFNKNSNTSLEFSGNTFYTFAVRTLKLKYKNDNWRIEPGTYAGTGLGGEDEKYSFSPATGSSNKFPPLELNFEVPKVKKNE